MPLTRRSLLKGAAVAGGLAALGGRVARADDGTGPTPDDLVPDIDGIRANLDTIVVVMMENRSFDHYLGWIEGARADRTRTYLDSGGTAYTPYHLAGDFKGCGHRDPGHSRGPGLTQLNGGACDGFVRNGDPFPLGYYLPEDIPVWASMVASGTTFDSYFCSVLTSTWPNRSYMHGATSSGRNGNSYPGPDGYPEETIWHACNEAGVSWAYYYSNLPFAGLYGPRFVAENLSSFRHIAAFHEDAALGRLPNVVFVDPFFTTPAESNGTDDHPLADIRLGQELLSGVITSFVDSPQFARGALFVNYDEWGGFFDTVAPPRMDDDHATEPFATDDFGQLGFRVPACVISPFAPKGALAPQIPGVFYEHTSILKLIESRWGMPPLSRRDAATRNIGEVLDFTLRTEPEIVAYTAPPDAYIACAAADALPVEALTSDWSELLTEGWFERVGLRTDYTLRDSLR